LAEIARISALHTSPDIQANTYAAAAALVSKTYAQRLALFQPQNSEVRSTQPDAIVLQELQLAAVRAERKSIFLSRRQKSISAAVARRLVRELDLLEAHFEV
jgi:hypothetical protein